MRADLAAPVGQRFIARLVPDQAGSLWIMLLVAVVVAVDFSRVRASHNVDLLIALALAAVFFDILMFARMRLVPEALTRLYAVFTAVTALNVALLLRAVWYACVPNAGTAWRPNLRGRPLAAIALLLVICNVATVLVREPDDAGYFTNLGAQRFRERGRLPYGDPLLTGTPGAAYGSDTVCCRLTVSATRRSAFAECHVAREAAARRCGPCTTCRPRWPPGSPR